VHHAPEIDVDQPLHLRLVDLVEGAEQRDTGVVDDDVQSGMRRDGSFSKILDLAGLADVDAVGADFPLRMILSDLGGDLLQPGLVAIGERQIAAARGKLQRQGAADAAGGAGHGGCTSRYRSHLGELHASRNKRAGSATFRKLEPNHKAL
jgi:hypothetical protein